jgi:hypothetical protein
MRGSAAILGAGISMCACAATSALGGSALIKAPVEQQCSRYGLKGCPELVDGVILYVDGDERGGTQQLERAAAKNTPAELKRFAQALSTVLPAKTGGRIVAILTGQEPPAAPAREAAESVGSNADGDEDAITPPGCKQELIIGATNADGRVGWLAPTSSPGFHGARFFVRPSQWVVVAARSETLDEPGDERCYVTWAAFKPRAWLPDM